MLPNNPCVGRKNGFYPDVNGDCGKLMFCVDGLFFGVDCPAGTVYNQGTNRCEQVDAVPAPCGQAPALDSFSCADLDDGLYGTVHHCSLYYKCEAKSLYALTCAEGEAFDRDIGQCRDADLVPGCMPNPVIDLFPFCTAAGRDGLFADPKDCTRAIVCVRRVSFAFICPPERPHFDSALLSCVENIDGCMAPPPVVPPMLNDEDVKKVINIIENAPDSVCSDLPDGFYAYKGDCRRYVFCALERPVLLNCAPGLVWNDEAKQCTLATLALAPCGVAPTPTPFSCAERDDGLYEDLQSCSVFYECKDKQVQESFTCKAGEAFDKVTTKCVPAAMIDECAPPKANNLSAYCAQQTRSGIFVDPTNCHRAIICIDQHAFNYECTIPGLPDFTPSLKRCVADVAECE
jgi:hypothetical protein